MKIIQIGVGGWGKNHTRILSQLGVLVAICDADSKKVKNMEKNIQLIITNH